jgi:hypothetical protein
MCIYSRYFIRGNGGSIRKLLQYGNDSLVIFLQSVNMTYLILQQTFLSILGQCYVPPFMLLIEGHTNFKFSDFNKEPTKSLMMI